MWPNVSRNRAARLRVDLGIGQKHEVADERPSPTEKGCSASVHGIVVQRPSVGNTDYDGPRN